MSVPSGSIGLCFPLYNQFIRHPRHPYKAISYTICYYEYTRTIIGCRAYCRCGVQDSSKSCDLGTSIRAISGLGQWGGFHGSPSRGGGVPKGGS